MNKKRILPLIALCMSLSIGYSQNLQVETILDLDASGGVTFGPDGNVYISDFGPALGSASSNTKVYKVAYGSWDVSEFATGFLGASGARFDSQGNFYQSNPSGGRVSKINTNGNVEYNWATSGLSSPIGITTDSLDNLYVCSCGNNSVRKITPDGSVSLFSSGALFNCPNGITIDPEENLYVCNFSDGRIIKITPDGTASLFKTFPVFGGVGNGHLTYSNGFLFVATIGTGQIYKLSLDGDSELIAGISQGFANDDGPALQATFSKPNGIAASYTGDTLWVNCSVPTWLSNGQALHPGKVRMISGVCSLEDVDCPLLTSNNEIPENFENEFARLFPLIPNPVQGKSVLNFQIHDIPQEVQLTIIDPNQKVIKILEKGRKPKGQYSYSIETNNWVPGIYLAVLELEGAVLTQKFVVIP